MTQKTKLDVDKTEALAERLFASATGALDICSVYLGDRLGLYSELKRRAMTTGELAKACRIHDRYAREWCEQQASTGLLDVDDASALPESRRYSLPAEHAEVLTDPDSAFSLAPLARAIISATAVLPQILEAYRTGGGVPWSAFGADGIESQGDFNRPWLRTALTRDYLPAIPDVHERLITGARVADVACGVGWAGITIARDYPAATVLGLDPDALSIDLARKFASEEGVAERTTFEVHDATQALPGGPFDLVLVVEALHDMSQPVAVLQRIRESLTDSGVVIVADEKVADVFAAPGDDIERFMYGVSLVMCLPAGMAEDPSAATGTVIRPATLRQYAEEAGFSGVEVVEQIDHPMLRFYRLHQ